MEYNEKVALKTMEIVTLKGEEELAAAAAAAATTAGPTTTVGFDD